MSGRRRWQPGSTGPGQWGRKDWAGLTWAGLGTEWPPLMKRNQWLMAVTLLGWLIALLHQLSPCPLAAAAAAARVMYRQHLY